MNDPVLYKMIFGTPLVESILPPCFDEMPKVTSGLKKLKHSKESSTHYLTSDDQEKLAMQVL